MDIPTTPFEATITDWQPTLDEYKTLLNEKQAINGDNERLRAIVERQSNEINDYRLKIKAVEGHIADIYSEDGEIDERVKEIAEYLGITLTKRISGDATFTISWSAQVPLDFDPDDMEISFDVDCESYEADDFEWQEENTEINGEEG